LLIVVSCRCALALISDAFWAVLSASGLVDDGLFERVGEEECTTVSRLVGSPLALSRNITAQGFVRVAVRRAFIAGKALGKGRIGGPSGVHETSRGARLARLRTAWGDMAIL
jgi:hypothetical protein